MSVLVDFKTLASPQAFKIHQDTLVRSLTYT